MKEPTNDVDTSVEVAKKIKLTSRKSQAAAELTNVSTTLAVSSDISSTESTQTILDSNSTNAIADSNIDNTSTV